MKKFILSENYDIICDYQKTRNGFKHTAKILENGNEVYKTKICYLNRTWERYEYQSVLHKAIDNYFDEKEANQFKEKVDNIKRDNPFKSVGMAMTLGGLICNTQEEKNKFKKRMLDAINGISFPENWDTLSEEEKAKRLKKIEDMINKGE